MNMCKIDVHRRTTANLTFRACASICSDENDTVDAPEDFKALLFLRNLLGFEKQTLAEGPFVFEKLLESVHCFDLKAFVLFLVLRLASLFDLDECLCPDLPCTVFILNTT